MRTSSWRRLVAALGLLTLTLGAACGGSPESQPEAEAETDTEATTPDAPDTAGEEETTTAAAGVDGTITIGWTPPDITGVFQTATNFFEQAAAEAGEHGIDVQVEARSSATHTAFADQVAIIEDYITTGVDVIAVSPAGVEAIKPAIEQANEAGIPVIMVNLLEEQEGIEVASYIGFSNSEAAAVSGYAVMDYFGGPGVLGLGEQAPTPEDGALDLEWWQSVYEGADLSDVEAGGTIIEGIAGDFFSRARVEGFNTAISNADGIEILAEPIAGNWNREDGTAAAETFLTRFGPGELDFIWGASNEMGLGAMLATERDGRLDTVEGDTPPGEGKVAIFTNDVTPESVQAISEGKIIAETHHGFAEWGWYGTAFAVRLACGLDVPQVQDINPRTVYQGNTDQFYPDIALPEIDWEEIASSCQLDG